MSTPMLWWTKITMIPCTTLKKTMAAVAIILLLHHNLTMYFPFISAEPSMITQKMWCFLVNDYNDCKIKYFLFYFTENVCMESATRGGASRILHGTRMDVWSPPHTWTSNFIDFKNTLVVCIVSLEYSEILWYTYLDCYNHGHFSTTSRIVPTN